MLGKRRQQFPSEFVPGSRVILNMLPGLVGTQAPLKRALVVLLEVQRQFLDDLELSCRRHAERRKILADKGSEVRHFRDPPRAESRSRTRASSCAALTTSFGPPASAGSTFFAAVPELRPSDRLSGLSSPGGKAPDTGRPSETRPRLRTAARSRLRSHIRAAVWLRAGPGSTARRSPFCVHSHRTLCLPYSALIYIAVLPSVSTRKSARSPPFRVQSFSLPPQPRATGTRI